MLAHPLKRVTNGVVMPLYEHVVISRQDLSNAQAEGLVEHFGKVLSDNGGKVVDSEYWGLKTMAYKINKNRKGHYMLLNIDSPPEAIQEYERLMRLDEDIIRFLTIKIKSINEKPSPLMVNKPDILKNETVTKETFSTTENE